MLTGHSHDTEGALQKFFPGPFAVAFLACLADLTHPTLRSDFHFTTALMPSYDNATRAQALTLKLVGFSNAEIEKITGIQPQTVSAIHRKAIARGLNPEESKKILDHHVEDAPRSGRPKKQTEEIVTEILSKVRGDRYACKKTCAQIAAEVGGVSDITVWRILRSAGFRKTKPTRKPDLTPEMKKARLQFALDHKDW